MSGIKYSKSKLHRLEDKRESNRKNLFKNLKRSKVRDQRNAALGTKYKKYNSGMFHFADTIRHDILINPILNGEKTIPQVIRWAKNVTNDTYGTVVEDLDWLTSKVKRSVGALFNWRTYKSSEHLVKRRRILHYLLKHRVHTKNELIERLEKRKRSKGTRTIKGGKERHNIDLDIKYVKKHK